MIGLSAALLRIRREEHENGHSGTLTDILSKGWKRQVASWTGQYNVERVGGHTVGKS